MDVIKFSIPQRGHYLVMQDTIADFSDWYDQKDAAALADEYEKKFQLKRVGPFSVVLVPKYAILSFTKVHLSAWRDELVLAMPKKYNKNLPAGYIWRPYMSKFFEGGVSLLDEDQLKQIAKNKQDFLSLNGLV